MDKNTQKIYAELSKPFSGKAVKSGSDIGKYGDYVEHAMVRQKLIAVLGNFTEKVPYHLKEELYNPKSKQLQTVLVGCSYQITANINGEQVTKESTGVVEHPFNWKTDADRLKVAESDAFKRCAMKFGVALHLYIKDEEFILHDLLKSKEVVQDTNNETQEVAP